MRREKDLTNVNVETRANNAAVRTGSNGQMQGTLHRLRHPKKSWFQRLQEQLPDSVVRALPSNWEHVTVNKQVESVTMPKWIAVGLLSAIVLFGYGAYTKSAEQRDALIRIEEKLATMERNHQEQQRVNGDNQAWRETMNGHVREIKGMLTQQQINALERLNNNKLNQTTKN